MGKVIRYLQLLVVAGCLYFCKQSNTINGYSKQNNFYYKLIAIGDGKIKPDSNQTLWIDVACRTLKDSVFWDSRHNTSQRLFIKKNSYSFSPHIFGFSVGDSLEYLIPSLTFYKEFIGFPKVAIFSEKDSSVKLSLRILQVLSPDELGHIEDSLRISNEQKKNEEFAQIKNYVTANFKNSIQLAHDAFMEITQTTDLDSIKTGKRVKMAYKGSYLDGRVVDYSPGDRSFEFTLGQEGQVIEGLRKALYSLKKGEKAKIILPSRLAFGNNGGSVSTIAPYSPLLYEVEILDVK